MGEKMSISTTGSLSMVAPCGQPGDILHFPPGCPHGATMLDEPVVLIDIFSPIREDFLPQ